MQCPLDIHEVIERLNAAVAQRRWIETFAVPTRPFEGEVTDTGFMIRRTGSYRKSYLPRVRARVDSVGSGTAIVGTMTSQPLGLVVTAIWAVALLGMLAFSPSGRPQTVVSAAGLLLTLMVGVFGWQARSTAEALEALLDAPVAWI
jgi:hypothetical protein